MIEDARTLVVVADGRHARLFEEPRRGGRLHERAEWLADLPEYKAARSPGPGSVHDRFGHGVHAAVSESPRDKGEHRFVVALAHRLEGVIRDHAFDALVVIAAPRALGVLRAALPAEVRKRLRETEASDRLRATPEDLTRALRALRQAA
jgi:protein required for attachment to host cells